ncbi:uncharacterized protein LOC118346091 [Juglans regia]|uniref:Uncharacterized protein LOC118346091 n=1 Tax=Juglans regia TaxID=51240 RepID=A0A6P9EJS5_JUGRE|nr:uncharacterized protein LOC118346091 [Juglans regia]
MTIMTTLIIFWISGRLEVVASSHKSWFLGAESVSASKSVALLAPTYFLVENCNAWDIVRIPRKVALAQASTLPLTCQNSSTASLHACHGPCLDTHEVSNKATSCAQPNALPSMRMPSEVSDCAQPSARTPMQHQRKTPCCAHQQAHAWHHAMPISRPCTTPCRAHQ